MRIMSASTRIDDSTGGTNLRGRPEIKRPTPQLLVLAQGLGLGDQGCARVTKRHRTSCALPRFAPSHEHQHLASLPDFPFQGNRAVVGLQGCMISPWDPVSLALGISRQPPRKNFRLWRISGTSLGQMSASAFSTMTPSSAPPWGAKKSTPPPPPPPPNMVQDFKPTAEGQGVAASHHAVCDEQTFRTLLMVPYLGFSRSAC